MEHKWIKHEFLNRPLLITGPDLKYDDYFRCETCNYVIKVRYPPPKDWDGITHPLCEIEVLNQIHST